MSHPLWLTVDKNMHELEFGMLEHRSMTGYWVGKHRIGLSRLELLATRLYCECKKKQALQRSVCSLCIVQFFNLLHVQESIFCSYGNQNSSRHNTHCKIDMSCICHENTLY